MQRHKTTKIRNKILIKTMACSTKVSISRNILDVDYTSSSGCCYMIAVMHDGINALSLFILSKFQIGHDTWFKACPIYSPLWILCFTSYQSHLNFLLTRLLIRCPLELSKFSIQCLPKSLVSQINMMARTTCPNKLFVQTFTVN